MKKNILGISLMIAIGLTACAQQKKASNSNTTKAATSTTTASATTDAGDINTIFMTRGACFGKCPSYTIELRKDGMAVYTSKMFTKYEGTFEKNVGADKVMALFQEFENYRVDTCTTYQSMIPDLPPLHYVITFDKKNLDIRNANFGPQYLTVLSKKIDALVQVDDTWKKTAEPKKQ